MNSICGLSGSRTLSFCGAVCLAASLGACSGIQLPAGGFDGPVTQFGAHDQPEPGGGAGPSTGDLAAIYRAIAFAAEAGPVVEATEWASGDGAASGEFIEIAAVGESCRSFRTVASVPAGLFLLSGRMCPQPGGGWSVDRLAPAAEAA